MLAKWVSVYISWRKSGGNIRMPWKLEWFGWWFVHDGHWSAIGGNVESSYYVMGVCWRGTRQRGVSCVGCESHVTLVELEIHMPCDHRHNGGHVEDILFWQHRMQLHAIYVEGKPLFVSSIFL